MDNISANFKLNHASGVKYDIPIQAQDLDKAGLDALKSMQNGETFSGRISELNGNSATIMIGDNARITANIDTNANLSVGQSVVFEVSNDNQNIVSLRALFTNLASENIANNALNQAGIAVNENSLALISTLMEEGMSIDKESLLQLYRAINANPEVAANEIVRMKQIGLELTSDNITKFDAVYNFQNKISDSINTVINQIPLELASKADSDLSSAIKMASDFIDSAMEGETQVSVSMGDIALSAEDSPLSEGFEQAEEALANDESLINGSDSKETIVQENVKSIISDMQEEGMLVTEDGEVINLDSSELELSEQISLTNKDFDSLASLVSKDNTFANGIVDKLSNGEKIDLEELLKTFDSILKDENISDESKKALIKSDLFKNSLTDKFSEKWLLEPAELKDSESLNNHYNKVMENTDKILDQMQNTFKGNENLTQSVNSFRENVQFLQTLNDLTPYVQLPVLLNNRSNTGDLYVYANKKNLLEHPDNISACLRLDMKNLGRVEVYVRLNTGKNLSMDYTLQDDDTLKFIEDHIDILDEKLQKLGFTVNNKFNTKSVAPEVLLEEENNESEKKDTIGFYRFDVRA